METLIEGLKIAVVLWSYVFWGIGLWVTILVSSQLRDSIDHRGESLTVPHPRRVSTPFRVYLLGGGALVEHFVPLLDSRVC
jgi:hypothetical protein